MFHELWKEESGEQTFCLNGPRGDAARKRLSPAAKLVWTVEAPNHYEAMRRYYEYMGWGTYTTDFPEQDKKTYKELGWE